MPVIQSKQVNELIDYPDVQSFKLPPGSFPELETDIVKKGIERDSDPNKKINWLVLFDQAKWAAGNHMIGSWQRLRDWAARPDGIRRSVARIGRGRQI